MKKIFLNIAAVLTMTIIFTGCGGGGGSSPATKVVTSAVTSMYLFGTMSSSSIVATLHSEITVPNGILVNYSSPPGATTGKFPLRSGSIVPSGPVKFSQSDITADYNLADRKLSIDCVNWPDFSTSIRKKIKSGTTGNGVEIATLNFKLATAGVLPTLPSPWQDIDASIYEETSSLSIINSTGLKLNFITAFKP